jgi:hypothetical protein
VHYQQQQQIIDDLHDTTEGLNDMIDDLTHVGKIHQIGRFYRDKSRDFHHMGNDEVEQLNSIIESQRNEIVKLVIEKIINDIVQ